ncbi:hypothetical protein V8B97DRAFT_2007726 [Scleroderma yunnanense]
MTDAHGSYPMLVAVSPVLDTADIVATATGVIKAKLHSLWENHNACYWREVVHVVWEQLWLPPGFVMPSHVIIINHWMPSPAMVEKTKSWPDWDKIIDAPNVDLPDHAWYQLQFQGEVEQVAMMDKGKGKAVDPPFGCGEDVTMPSDVHASNDAREEHRGQTRSHPACKEQCGCSQSQKCQKGMTSTSTLNMDDNMLAAMKLAPTPAASMGICGCCMAAINSPPDGFSIRVENPIPLHIHPATVIPPAKPQPHYLPIHQLLAHPIKGVHQARVSHLASQGDQAAITPSPTGKLTVLDGVVIVTPSWLTTTSWPSTPGSVAANTGSIPPTTPSGTGSASSDNTARIDTLEAKVLALKKELVVKSHQLDDTWCKVSSLCDIVEALQQEHYPLAQGLMGPIQHTTTLQPGPMLRSTCHAITPAMVTLLDYTWQVDLAPTTMVEEVPSHPNTPINDMLEMQQQLPAPASIEDAPTHTDGATAPDAPLVLATPAIIVSTLDDAVLIGSGEDNGANDMHVD